MKHFLILFVTLCLCHGLSASPAAANGDSDYEDECPGNSCDAPPGQGGGSADAFAEAYSEAFARAFVRSYINAGGGEASASGLGVGSVVIEGDNFQPPDLSKTPGTPASVGVDACGGGFSISAPGVGATGTKPSRFCHLLTLANVFQNIGERAVSPTVAASYLQTASELREEARKNVNRRGRLTRWLHLDELPIVGWLFFRD